VPKILHWDIAYVMCDCLSENIVSKIVFIIKNTTNLMKFLWHLLQNHYKKKQKKKRFYFLVMCMRLYKPLCQLVGWSVGWLVSWLVGCLVGGLVSWSVGWLVGWLVCWSVGQSVGC